MGLFVDLGSFLLWLGTLVALAVIIYFTVGGLMFPVVWTTVMGIGTIGMWVWVHCYGVQNNLLDEALMFVAILESIVFVGSLGVFGYLEKLWNWLKN